MENKLNDEDLYALVFKVVEEFYELVYKDEWFSKIFRNIKQEIITTQQTDFMVQAFGGPKKFCGRSPSDAHPQIWINEEMWEFREKLLVEAFNKLGIEDSFREKWLRIDNAFKASIINSGGVEECVGRYKSDEIIYEPSSATIRKAG